MKKTKRKTKRPASSKHRVTHQSRQVLLEPRAIQNVPKKCDKCGCVYIGIDIESLSFETIRMARCLGSLGGCGKTWRLANIPVDCYPEGTRNGDSSD